MIQSFTKYGYSYHHGSTAPANITTTYQVFPVTVDATNSTNSASFPDDCNIQSIEFEVTTIGHGVSTKGGAIFSNEIDYHFDGGSGAGVAIPGTSRGTIYVVAKRAVAAGTDASITNIRVNWRS